VVAVLAAASLSRNPFADVGRTVSECDANRFAEGQEFHRITVDQLDFREFYGDDTDFFERGPKDFQVFSCTPPTDVESNTPFNPKSVDSARQGRASLFACCHTGKPNASRTSSENAAKAKDRAACELVRPVDLGDLVDLVDFVAGGL
jgi:hypothetical protein